MPPADSTLPPDPRRPQRESWTTEVGIAAMGLVLLAVFMLAGSWIWGWARRQVAPPPPSHQQDPVVSQYRRVGFEIGRNAEGQIQVITTPNPLLVTDKDLALITGLEHLEVLDLRGTQITNEALSHLTDLPRLEQLYLGGSVVTDVEPTLFRSRFTDEAVPKIASLKGLKVLSLARTDIGDAGVRHLASLSNLEVLYLLGTDITDASAETLQQITTLKQLYLQETALSTKTLAHLRRNLTQTTILPEPTEPAIPALDEQGLSTTQTRAL